MIQINSDIITSEDFEKQIEASVKKNNSINIEKKMVRIKALDDLINKLENLEGLNFKIERNFRENNKIKRIIKKLFLKPFRWYFDLLITEQERINLEFYNSINAIKDTQKLIYEELVNQEFGE